MSPITRKIQTDSSEPEEMNITEPVSRSNYGKAGLLFLFLLATLFFGSTTYYYRENSKLKNNPQKSAQESSVELINKISKLIVLPQGESPTIATVTDPEKLRKEQSFFANASVGDKILIYTGARQAFMYNPKLNKIIIVAPIILGDQNSPPQTPSPTPPPPQPEQPLPTGTP